jgi:hypothetical protein
MQRRLRHECARQPRSVCGKTRAVSAQLCVLPQIRHFPAISGMSKPGRRAAPFQRCSGETPRRFIRATSPAGWKLKPSPLEADRWKLNALFTLRSRASS